MSKSPEKVVFDCNVYFQCLLSATGPARRCVDLALAGEVELLVSDDVLAELYDIPEKDIAIRSGIDNEVVRRFVERLLKSATYVTPVPPVFVHPIDKDDSCYINLALAGDAKLIVSRDKHLLGLGEVPKPWAADFRKQFPQLRILSVDKFLKQIDNPLP